ncbi:hypothetical protein C7M84_012771 [Penaeus vannamei]|uniref:Uncharacterized protein n=1 Tax=Penaeus vannamei TaxID=6689 RepID=A0A423SYE7_PENVA|nr:hypothetical protein C7M84_012771 [Penaeus vannamei]
MVHREPQRRRTAAWHDAIFRGLGSLSRTRRRECPAAAPRPEASLRRAQWPPNCEQENTAESPCAFLPFSFPHRDRLSPRARSHNARTIKKRERTNRARTLTRVRELSPSLPQPARPPQAPKDPGSPPYCRRVVLTVTPICHRFPADPPWETRGIFGKWFDPKSAQIALIALIRLHFPLPLPLPLASTILFLCLHLHPPLSTFIISLLLFHLPPPFLFLCLPLHPPFHLHLLSSPLPLASTILFSVFPFTPPLSTFISSLLLFHLPPPFYFSVFTFTPPLHLLLSSPLPLASTILFLCHLSTSALPLPPSFYFSVFTFTPLSTFISSPLLSSPLPLASTILCLPLHPPLLPSSYLHLLLSSLVASSPALSPPFFSRHFVSILVLSSISNGIFFLRLRLILFRHPSSRSPRPPTSYSLTFNPSSPLLLISYSSLLHLFNLSSPSPLLITSSSLLHLFPFFAPSPTHFSPLHLYPLFSPSSPSIPILSFPLPSHLPPLYLHPPPHTHLFPPPRPREDFRAKVNGRVTASPPRPPGSVL